MKKSSLPLFTFTQKSIMNTCQIIVLSVIIAVSADETLPWTGPLADNKIGQLVEDTPEVAAAKRQHAEAFSLVQKTLPELPVEEKFPGGHVFPQVTTYRPTVFPLSNQHYVPPQQPQFIPQVVTQAPLYAFPTEPTSPPWMGPFADHVLGQRVHETPEVAAARRLHEEIYSKVRSVLPELPPQKEEPFEAPQQVVPEVRNYQHQDIQRNENLLRSLQDATSLLRSLQSTSTTPAPLIDWNLLTDTPEIAAARLEHARAFGAVFH